MADEFDAIVAGISIEEPDDTLRVDQLDDFELVTAYRDNRRLLLTSGQMVADLPTTHHSTQAGRDLHSERTALIVEMRKRGLM